MRGSLTTLVTLLTLLVGCTQGACPSGYTRSDEYCFRVAEYVVNKTVTYEQAKEQCPQSLSPRDDDGQWKSSLVVLDDTEKLEALSRLVFDVLGKPTSGLVFWVGGEYRNGAWRWVDGTKVNLRSYIFVPGHPPANGTNFSFYLVPADQTNNRLYTTVYQSTRGLPSYVCEATRD